MNIYSRHGTQLKAIEGANISLGKKVFQAETFKAKGEG